MKFFFLIGTAEKLKMKEMNKHWSYAHNFSSLLKAKIRIVSNQLLFPALP